MKQRLPYILLAVAALGLLLYASSLVRTPDGARGAGDGLLLPAGPTSAASVRVEAVAGSLRLERRRAAWLVNGRPADSAAVADLLATLEGARLGPRVARDPEAHPGLGVDGEARRVAVITEDGREIAFRLGEPAPEGGHYVRREGEADVYLLPDPVGGLLERPAEGWRDRRIAAVDTAAVREIVIRRDDQELTLRRGERGWRVEDAVADPATVATLLRELADLRASGFPSLSEEEAADFSAPDGLLSAFVEEPGDVIGRNLAVSLRFLRASAGGGGAAGNGSGGPAGNRSAPEDAAWLVRRADEAHAFQISAETARRLLPSRRELAAR